MKDQMKKWIVRNNFCYRVNKDTVHNPMEIFEATDEQIASQKWKVMLFKDFEAEMKKIEAEKDKAAGRERPPRKRSRGRPPRSETVEVAEAPVDRAM